MLEVTKASCDTLFWTGRLCYLDKGVPAAGGLQSAERLDHTVSDGQEGAMGQTGGQ